MLWIISLVLPNFTCLLIETNGEFGRVEGLKYDVGGPPLTFKIEFHYQGPEILDPKQPTPEEIEEQTKQLQAQIKKAPKKAAEFQAQIEELKKPRMILPKCFKVGGDTGRKIRLELMKEEEEEKGSSTRKSSHFRLDYRALIAKKKEENQKAKEELEKLAKEAKEGPPGKAGKKDVKKPGKPAAQAPPAEDLDRVNIFKEDEPQDEKPLRLTSTNGELLVSALEFPDNFPAGNYRLLVHDETVRLPFASIPTKSFEIVIVNALLGQPGKGAKKK